MKKLLICLCLSIFIVALISEPGFSQRYEETVLTNDDNLARNSERYKKVTDEAEIRIFSAQPQKRRKLPPAEKILTGVFSGRPSFEAASLPALLPASESANSSERSFSRKKTDISVAWVADGSLEFHDPFLDCGKASGSQRIWVNGVKELCGLDPCEECFFKTDHPPAFIKKESGGLDLASAAVLLDNKAFLSWLETHLPVKTPSFLSTRKLLIYPKLEMTRKGLWQLAKEVELAYRRHSWRVIEVMAKQSEIDTQSVSSFEDFEENSDRPNEQK